MSNEDTKKRKPVCPYCGVVDSRVMLGPKARANDLWLKCKICKKIFELKVP